MISRRGLLATAVRHLPAAGLAAAMPIPRGASCTSAVSSLLGAGGEDWLRTAPRARYWTSVALAGGNCRSCHGEAQGLDPAHRHEPDTVRCLLCAQACSIKPGRSGQCRARVNVNGELRSLVYGRPVAIQVDPIEKKPFYHFLPGSRAFSIGSSGCPLHCRFCQNWELSQSTPGDLDASFTPPASLVGAAAERRAPVIAFTYNEPTTFAEYALDVARDARAKGIRSVMVSCGFMTEGALTDLCGALAAIKIDLKGFSESFYRTVCGAELQPVLRSIRQIARSRTHLEIVNLVVPTLNDAATSMKELVTWIAGEVGPDVPVHFTRFHPDYQLQNLPPTPVATLERARALAMDAGLRYVYVGNVPGHEGNHTYCPKCHKVVISRENFFVSALHLRNGRCAFCQQPIAGVWA